MAKVLVEIDRVMIEPELVLNPPVGSFVNKPTREELKQLLKGYTPQQWDEGDATILTDHGQLGIFYDSRFGYILVAFKPREEPDYLMAHEPTPETQEAAIHNGEVYYVLDNFFVPFKQLWQGITYYLDHKDLDPSLLWTKGIPEND